MALTNAERQARYRERKRAEREGMEQAAGVHIPGDKAAGMRKTRRRNKTVRQVTEAAESRTPDVDVEAAADALIASESAARRYARDDLKDALEVGRCCRIWEEIAGGYTAPQEELADWLASDPRLAWLFYSWVRSSPWAREFRAWEAEWLPDA